MALETDDVNTDFEFSQGNEEWTIFESKRDDRISQTYPAKHNAEGYIEGEDKHRGSDFYFMAPESFLKGIRKASPGSRIEFDFYTTATDNTTYETLVVESPEITIVLPKPYPPINQWNNYSYRFDTSEGWKIGGITTNGERTATADEIRKALATAKALYIRGEWSSGFDSARLDNVRLSHQEDTGPK